jgi:hypothetical protein
MAEQSAPARGPCFAVLAFSAAIGGACGLPDARPGLPPLSFPGMVYLPGVSRERDRSPPPPRVQPALPFAVPGSLRAEHERIQAALTSAAKDLSTLGGAARALSDVLQPHVEREETLALAPLGLLGPLAEGKYHDGMQTVLPRTDLLRGHLPELLAEHDAIRSAAQRLQTAARQAGRADLEQLARELIAHTRMEDEVCYPAALLVGDVVRASAEQQAAP